MDVNSPDLRGPQGSYMYSPNFILLRAFFDLRQLYRHVHSEGVNKYKVLTTNKLEHCLANVGYNFETITLNWCCLVDCEAE